MRPRKIFAYYLIAGSLALILCYSIFAEHLALGINGYTINASMPQIAFLIFIGVVFPLIWIRTDAFAKFIRSIDSDTPNQKDRFLLASILGCLIAIGFSLRLANLDKFGLVLDEALFIYAAGHETLAEAIRESSIHFHPPANFFMLFLQLKISWNPTWLRMGSVISGTYLIWISYLFGRQIFSSSAGLMMALLVTFSANLVQLSRVCRNYSPYFAFLVTALYFLIRFSKEGRWAWFYCFAAFAFISSLWYYGSIVPILGANLWLIAVFASDQRPARDWAKAFFAQIPTGLVFLAALFIHLPVTMQGLSDRIVTYMADEFILSPYQPYSPIHALIRYLVADRAGASFALVGGLFSLLFLLGVGMLWLAKKRRELLFCLAPLPFAYILAFWAQKIPMGGTRHAAHLFPIIFAVIGSQVAPFASGFPGAFQTAFRNISNRAAPPPTVPGDEINYSRWGTLAIGALCLFYVQCSLGLYAYEEPYEQRQRVEHIEIAPYYKGKFYKVKEAPTRTDDLARVWVALKQYAGPNDIVMLSYATLLTLRFYLENPHHPVSFDIDTPVAFSHEGVNFYYSPKSQWSYSPKLLMESVADANRYFGLENVDKVWTAQAGWEIWATSLVGWVQRVYPDMLLDTPAVRESRGLVFALDAQAARLEGERLLQEEASENER